MTAAPDLRARVIAGAIAGIAGTVAMTAAMRRLHALLPAQERYPLPPREITERLLPGRGDATTQDLSIVSHTAFGAAAGAAMAGARLTGPVASNAWGLLVWLGSYFGWVPLGGILRPADQHPARRNGLIILAHLVWGSATALAARELLAARTTMLAEGPLRDAPPEPNSRN